MDINKYKNDYMICTAVISIPAVLLTFTGILFANVVMLLFGAALLLLWWGVYYLLYTDRKLSIPISLILLFIFWLPVFIQTIRRVSFIYQNGGFERADGYGSPLLFLINFTMELLFFIPITMTLTRFVIYRFRK
ncbi:MAG: hypothetical protein C0609_10895 [Deltaproteobacteria bacterium]|nr:MAG: hypothetical protein C0609_10895 [Deltaproteobacteria bacterium]